jgi:hypothetical protein
MSVFAAVVISPLPVWEFASQEPTVALRLTFSMLLNSPFQRSHHAEEGRSATLALTQADFAKSRSFGRKLHTLLNQFHCTERILSFINPRLPSLQMFPVLINPQRQFFGVLLLQ